MAVLFTVKGRRHGKQLDSGLILIFRVQEGRIVEEWEIFDQLGMLQQLGVIPTEATA